MSDPSAFTVADARRTGVTRRAIDSARLARPFHGIRSATADDIDGVHPHAVRQEQIAARAAIFAVGMQPDEFFSHTTAAAIWGLWLPWLPDARIHVSVRAPRRARRGAGVRGHQLDGRHVSTLLHPVTGLPVTSVATTWALLGGELRHPYDLVAAADCAVRVDRVAGPHGWVRTPALTSIARLERALAPNRRGTRDLRLALTRCRAGSASRMETWLRLTLIDAGLPEPVLDHDVYADDGRFLGCVDLAYPELRIAIEYEGDHHRTDADQWQRDIEKHDDLMRAGWRVIRVTRRALLGEPHTVVTRVRQAIASAR